MDYSGAVLEIPRLPDPQPQNRALGSYLTHPPDSTHGRTIPSKGGILDGPNLITAPMWEPERIDGNKPAA
eukprot:Em0019g1a